MAKKTTTNKPKVTIYISENCGYCGTMKEKFNEKEVRFTEKDTKEYNNEWNEVAKLTGLPTTPTIEFNGNYYIPGRDFQNPNQIVDYIKDWDSDNEIDQPNDVKLLEAFKTLTYTLNMSLGRLQGDLHRLIQQEYTSTKSQPTNPIPQDGNKSNN